MIYREEFMEKELQEAIVRFKETKNILEKFPVREEAIEFLVKETGLSKEECATAYDILMKIDE